MLLAAFLISCNHKEAPAKMNTTKIIKQYYDENAQLEWERIENRPEFLIACRFLDRYIKPGDRVLDIGGGPGRYALYLAKKGCDVTLLDLSDANVALAKANAREKDLPLTALQGDARKAHHIAGEEPFDHVLLMGPLYHLLKEEERVEAIESALSCLKEGGKLYATFISLYAGMIFAMKFRPEIVLDPAEAGFQKLLIDNREFAGKGFTQCHMAVQREVLPFMERFPLKKLHFLGQEGVMTLCEDNIMSQSPAVINWWLDLSEAVCERDELLSWSEHLLYIGEKTK